MGRIGGSAYLPLGASPRKGRAGLDTQGDDGDGAPRSTSWGTRWISEGEMPAPRWHPGRRLP